MIVELPRLEQCQGCSAPATVHFRGYWCSICALLTIGNKPQKEYEKEFGS